MSMARGLFPSLRTVVHLPRLPWRAACYSWAHCPLVGDNVKSATPSENWFTVDEGWPPHVIARSSNTSSDALCSIGPMAVPREAVAPRCLTPTRREEPALYPPPSSTLGEVRVELLEARGLIAADTFSQNDVYGVMVCEGHAAVTVTLENMQHPRWQAFLALCFPRHLRALLIVAILFMLTHSIISNGSSSPLSSSTLLGIILPTANV